MLKIKIQGLESVTFDSKLHVKGTIPGYVIEHRDLEGKLCEESIVIYPKAQYESDMEKRMAICTELSCNEGKLVSFYSTDDMVENIDVNGALITIREIYETYKDHCKILYECDYTGIKATKGQLHSIVKCGSDMDCDYCSKYCGRYYAFDLDEYKVRLEVSGEDSAKTEDMEYRIEITTEALMKEIEKLEAE